jgi:hypothetical protein
MMLGEDIVLFLMAETVRVLRAVEDDSLLMQLICHVQRTNTTGKAGGIGKANQKLQSGFSFLFVILVALLGMLVGYLLGG